jgi:putative lipoic acid-binding regulatory protein
VSGYAYHGMLNINEDAPTVVRNYAAGVTVSYKFSMKSLSKGRFLGVDIIFESTSL